jgi:glucosamine kinase
MEYGLGIDAGGTATRWALADTLGGVVAQGEVGGISALQMSNPAGRDAIHAQLATMAAAVTAQARPVRVFAGVTGFGGDSSQLAGLMAQQLSLPATAITLCSDIELAYRARFSLGEGYLIVAGTGSIGALIDADGQFHRAGGRGVILDDGGGGFWIARAALRHIWRGEDEAPGRWRNSPMAHAVFAHIGSAEWDASRKFMYTQERGTVGKLATAVASAAESDPVAMAILHEAGQELARLAIALLARFGPRPVALSGRAFQLHPAIGASLRAALPAGTVLLEANEPAHVAAAFFAAKSQ